MLANATQQNWSELQRGGDRMRKMLGAALPLLGMLTVDGCGGTLATLNQLAAVGSIHEDAKQRNS
jgi:hypothetical protein